jgi:TRAP-type C4-dicarboxylate transport system permease small subunit
MIARIAFGAARLMAVLGGLVLTALIVLTCLSIAGRWLNGLLNADALQGVAAARWLLDLGIGPIEGDFELVEAGMAFVVFAFLPITQLTGGHASVDVATRLLGARANRWLAATWAILFAAVLALIARQLALGTVDKMRYGETTFLIQFPVWWAYAAALVGALVAAATAGFVALARLVEAATGAAILPEEGAGP